MDQNQTTTKPSSTLIRVRNIPFTTTDEEFSNLFKDIEIKSAQIVRRKNRSKGYGFVTVLKESDQNNVIEKINNMELNSRKLSASAAIEATESETIAYVSNIPWSWKDEELRNLFKDLNVKTSRVVVSRTGRSRGFGFVEFSSNEELQNACKLNETKVEERPLTIRASKKGNVFGNTKNVQNIQSNNKVIKVTKPKIEHTLYVTNLPYELDENDLKQIFNEFNVKAAKVPVRRNGKSKGYGFVEFDNEKDLNDAHKALDQSEINGRLVTIQVAQKVRKQRPPRRGNNFRNNDSRDNSRNNNNSRGSSSRYSRNNNSSRNNSRNNNNNSRDSRRRSPFKRNERKKKEVSQTMLHVSNLPYTIDDQQLALLFKDFKVKSAQVVKQTNGTSAGHAFVDFESHEEQQRAFRNNNKSEIQGRKYFLQQAWK